MSIGVFMGIRPSYAEEAQDSAEDYLAAINVALASRGLPPYVEAASPPDVYNGTLFGRSALDAQLQPVLGGVRAHRVLRAAGGHV